MRQIRLKQSALPLNLTKLLRLLCLIMVMLFIDQHPNAWCPLPLCHPVYNKRSSENILCFYAKLTLVSNPRKWLISTKLWEFECQLKERKMKSVTLFVKKPFKIVPIPPFTFCHRVIQIVSCTILNMLILMEYIERIQSHVSTVH